MFLEKDPAGSLMRALILSLLIYPMLAFAAPACDEACRHDEALELLGSGSQDAAKSILEQLSSEGYAPATVTLAEICIVKEKDLDGGRALLLPLAETGDANAQFHLATSYLGRGSEAWDREGIKWLLSSAEQKLPESMEMLAFALERGFWGLPKDPSRAAELRRNITQHLRRTP